MKNFRIDNFLSNFANKITDTLSISNKEKANTHKIVASQFYINGLAESIKKCDLSFYSAIIVTISCKDITERFFLDKAAVVQLRKYSSDRVCLNYLSTASPKLTEEEYIRLEDDPDNYYLNIIIDKKET